MLLLSALLVLAASPSPGATRARGEDLAVVDTAAILPTAGGADTSHQRYYLPEVPALPAPGLGVRWQHRRQDAIDCGDDSHNCLDAGPKGAGICCDNDRYCFVNKDFVVRCCAQGNVCSTDTPCTDGDNYCSMVRTVTTTLSLTSVPASPPLDTDTGTATATATDGTLTTADAGEVRTTELVTYETVAACCNRACATDQFLCPPGLGGQCCGVGLQCGSSGVCLSTVSPTAPPVAKPIPDGCTYTWQFSCAASEGRGCCATGQTCRSPTFCDGEAAEPTATGANGQPIEAVDDGGGDLSPQAKIGVGVGAGVGGTALVAAAAVAFFCMRRPDRDAATGAAAVGNARHEDTTLLSDGAPGGNGAAAAARDEHGRHQQHHGGGGSNNNNNSNAPGSGSGGGGGAAAVAQRIRDRLLAGPLSPAAQFFHLGGRGGGGGQGTIADSETSGATNTDYGERGLFGVGGSGRGRVARPPLHQSGLTYPYYGPEAAVGPFTEVDPPTVPPGPGMSPPAEHNHYHHHHYLHHHQGGGGGGGGGTDLRSPYGPDDIVAPAVGLGVGPGAYNRDRDQQEYWRYQQQQQQQQQQYPYQPQHSSPVNERGERVGMVIGGVEKRTGSGEDAHGAAAAAGPGTWAGAGAGAGAGAAGGAEGSGGDDNKDEKKEEDGAYGPFELVGSPGLPPRSPSPPLSPVETVELRLLGAISPSPELGVRTSQETSGSKH